MSAAVEVAVVRMVVEGDEEDERGGEDDADDNGDKGEVLVVPEEVPPRLSPLWPLPVPQLLLPMEGVLLLLVSTRPLFIIN